MEKPAFITVEIFLFIRREHTTLRCKVPFYIKKKVVKSVSKLIILDAGCGMRTPGRHCLKEIDQNETREWFLNNRIIDKIEQILTVEYDCQVLRVGDLTGARNISVKKRIKAANAVKGDVYISLRHGKKKKKETEESGTKVTYFSVREEKKAICLYEELVSHTGLKNERGKVRACNRNCNYKKAYMPFFVVENGFMDHPKDVPIILKESHARKTARGIVAFLEKEYGVLKKSKSDPVYDTSNFYYPKYTGRNVNLAAALSGMGISANFKSIRKIAAANQISCYMGTYGQNMQIYNLFRAGILKMS